MLRDSTRSPTTANFLVERTVRLQKLLMQIELEVESDLDAHGNAFSVTDQLVVVYFYQCMDEDTVIRFPTEYGTMVHAVQGVYPP